MFHPYSGRSTPIFKQAPKAYDAGERLALPTEPEFSASLPGQYLNKLDVELTAGLESYMPTPIFRLRVARGRLREEIGNLREQLAQYERMPDKSPDMLARMNRLQYRLAVMEARERKVAGELAAMLPLGKWMLGLFQMFGGAGAALPELAGKMRDWLTARLHGEDYLIATRTTRELWNLQQVFAVRLADPRVSPAELGQILSVYDRLYEQARRGLSRNSKTNAEF